MNTTLLTLTTAWKSILTTNKNCKFKRNRIYFTNKDLILDSHCTRNNTPKTTNSSSSVIQDRFVHLEVVRELKHFLQQENIWTLDKLSKHMQLNLVEQWSGWTTATWRPIRKICSIKHLVCWATKNANYSPVYGRLKWTVYPKLPSICHVPMTIFINFLNW